jgi:O-antigen/teichoic acid export membrane protein
MTLGAIWSFVETSGAGLLSFVITMVLARLLGPEHFGVVAIAYAIVAVTQPLVRSGFPTAIIQRYELSQEHISTAFWLTILLGCVLAVSLFSAAPWIAALYDLPLLTPVIRLLSADGRGLGEISGLDLLRRIHVFRRRLCRSLAV